MYNNPYLAYNNQPTLDRINAQMMELEKMKEQLQKPIQPPTNLTQNFQIAPSNRDLIRYANSMEEVQREMVVGDTPFFSKDMAVLWLKNAKGDIKTYELKELIVKDDKDVKIEFLISQIEELKKGMKEHESINRNVKESIEDEEPASVPAVSRSTKKSK